MKDTSKSVHQKQMEIIFSKTPAERFMMGIEMCRAARQMVEAGIKRNQQNISKEELTYAVFKRYYPSLVAESEQAWLVYLLHKEIEKLENFDEIIVFYKEFMQKQTKNSEKNYNFLFTALFKKVKSKDDFAFVQSEIYRLGLKMDSYTQNFYDNLVKKYR